MTSSSTISAPEENNSIASSGSDWNSLPTSVRGAPPELRRLIRKRQNSESAKRCRQRRKLEKKREVDTATVHTVQMRALESVVQHLSGRLNHVQAMVSQLIAHQHQHHSKPQPTRTGSPQEGMPLPLPPREGDHHISSLPLTTIEQLPPQRCCDAPLPVSPVSPRGTDHNSLLPPDLVFSLEETVDELILS